MISQICSALRVRRSKSFINGLRSRPVSPSTSMNRCSNTSLQKLTFCSTNKKWGTQLKWLILVCPSPIPPTAQAYQTWQETYPSNPSTSLAATLSTALRIFWPSRGYSFLQIPQNRGQKSSWNSFWGRMGYSIKCRRGEWKRGWRWSLVLRGKLVRLIQVC